MQGRRTATTGRDLALGCGPSAQDPGSGLRSPELLTLGRGSGPAPMPGLYAPTEGGGRPGAGTEAGGSIPHARRHPGTEGGVAGGAGPGETQTSPRAGRPVAVTSRRVGARARLTLAAGRKARKVAGPCGPGTLRSASRPLPMPRLPFRPAQTLFSGCASLHFRRALLSALPASRGPVR